MVMYEMFTGQLPFENFQMRVHCPPADPRKYAPDMPEALVRVILRAMEVDLSRRYANATEMVGDLKKVGAALNPLPCAVFEDREPGVRQVPLRRGWFASAGDRAPRGIRSDAG